MRYLCDLCLSQKDLFALHAGEFYSPSDGAAGRIDSFCAHNACVLVIGIFTLYDDLSAGCADRVAAVASLGAGSGFLAYVMQQLPRGMIELRSYLAVFLDVITTGIYPIARVSGVAAGRLDHADELEVLLIKILGIVRVILFGALDHVAIDIDPEIPVADRMVLIELRHSEIPVFAAVIGIGSVIGHRKQSPCLALIEGRVCTEGGSRIVLNVQVGSGLILAKTVDLDKLIGSSHGGTHGTALDMDGINACFKGPVLGISANAAFHMPNAVGIGSGGYHPMAVIRMRIGLRSLASGEETVCIVILAVCLSVLAVIGNVCGIAVNIAVFIDVIPIVEDVGMDLTGDGTGLIVAASVKAGSALKTCIGRGSGFYGLPFVSEGMKGRLIHGAVSAIADAPMLVFVISDLFPGMNVGIGLLIELHIVNEAAVKAGTCLVALIILCGQSTKLPAAVIMLYFFGKLSAALADTIALMVVGSPAFDSLHFAVDKTSEREGALINSRELIGEAMLGRERCRFAVHSAICIRN